MAGERRRLAIFCDDTHAFLVTPLSLMAHTTMQPPHHHHLTSSLQCSISAVLVTNSNSELLKEYLEILGTALVFFQINAFFR